MILAVVKLKDISLSHTQESTHCREMITVRLVSTLTRMDLTKEEKYEVICLVHFTWQSGKIGGMKFC